MQINLVAEARTAGLEAIREVLTEENTDELIALILEHLKLPFWMRWLPIGAVLDRLLPDTLLRIFEKVLSHEG